MLLSYLCGIYEANLSFFFMTLSGSDFTVFLAVHAQLNSLPGKLYLNPCLFDLDISILLH